jgi:cell division protease FtsH
MVMEYGMSRQLGPVNLSGPRRTQFLQGDGGGPQQRNYSEETAREIDAEIRGLIDGTYERVRKLLTQDRQALEVLARRLLEKEVVDEGELREIMGLPPRRHEPGEDRVVETPPVAPLGGTQAAASPVDETRTTASPAELTGTPPMELDATVADAPVPPATNPSRRNKRG